MSNLREKLKEYLHLMDQDDISQVLNELSNTELLELWHDMNDEEASEFFLLLSEKRKVEFLTHLPEGDQEWLLLSINRDSTKEILMRLEPDDLADIIQAISPEVRESVWNSLSDEAKQETRFLLKFDEDDAAGLMTPRYVALRSNITVAQAIQFIRRGVEDIETIYYVYVVDPLKRLQGVISLREILFSNDNDRIGDKMVQNVVSVREDTDQEEVAKTLEDYDFLALPVVDRYNRLLGIVTFDDVIDVIREEQTEDIYRMGAMEGSADIYLETSVWGMIKKRIPWLIILLVLGTVTTNVLDAFGSIFASAYFLTLFIPVITQTGGNSGTQSSTLIIRGLAMGDLNFRDIGRVMLKELLVGLLMGVLLGLVILLRSVFLPPGLEVYQAMVVGISLVFVVLFSSLLGALAPLVIHRLGGDPTVIAGPLMSTFIDLTGITIYSTVAKELLSL
ncbi:magnesium transporter [Spirochaeta lutea]|uniref:Magnesium transporter MgtE n=1 Tax=Spirochaeta lutea TaxID=1480694 RepID=A0A098QSC5_9SPIO|nr:magnesium transporter [Spirochaeta lutea]KGE70785.1 magnesium transporter [Spirochaeta lutea]